MRTLCVFAALVAFSIEADGQTRTELAARFGSARSETFLLDQNVKLTATYDASARVCTLRIETPEHSERVAPNLTDHRYWIDAQQITRLVAELVPDSARQGPIQHSSLGLRVGEQMLTESDDAVQITRIQRSRPLPITRELPVADRLVTILWKRKECR
jgi:hypothetical protein